MPSKKTSADDDSVSSSSSVESRPPDPLPPKERAFLRAVVRTAADRRRHFLAQAFDMLRDNEHDARLDGLSEAERQVLAVYRSLGAPASAAQNPASGVSGTGEKPPSTFSSGNTSRNSTPNENSLSELLSSGSRFKRQNGHQVNLELFSSKLRQTSSRVVVDHETWPQYALTGASYNEFDSNGDIVRKDTTTALNKQLDTIRSFADTLSKDDLNGSNMDYVQRHPDRFNNFDGEFDLGPCMAQIRLYEKQPYQWPPFWNLGKGSTYAGDSSLRYEGAISDQFSTFLRDFSVRTYTTISQNPSADHTATGTQLLPSRFNKDDPFNSLAVSYTEFIKYDDFLANAWLQFCDTAEVGEPELPWRHLLERIMKMPQNPHKFADMCCVSEHFCGTEASINVSDVSGRWLTAHYDPNIAAEHYLDYLLQLQAESEKQSKKLTGPLAIASYRKIDELAVVSRFADSIDLQFKVEPADAYGKGLFALADAWRNRGTPLQLNDIQRASLQTLRRTDTLMAALRQLSTRCGRGGTSPPAKYQLRHSAVVASARTRDLSAHVAEEAHVGNDSTQNAPFPDYGSYELAH